MTINATKAVWTEVIALGHYEAVSPDGSEKWYSADGDIWFNLHLVDSAEFHRARIVFVGGPRSGETIA